MKPQLALKLGLISGCLAGLATYVVRARQPVPMVVTVPAPYALPVETLPVAQCVHEEGTRLYVVRADPHDDYSDPNYERLTLLGWDLRGRDLRDADFFGTVLRGVDFTGAKLDGARFDDATFDAATRWPAGFDPVEHGARPQ
jgi:hypothetical protein